MLYHVELWQDSRIPILLLNEEKSDLISRILMPYLAGRVVWIESKKSLLNMSCVANFAIYRSETAVSSRNPFMEGLRGADFENCTQELVAEVRQIVANPDSAPYMKSAFAEPKKQLFVIMKFGDEALDSAYEGVIKPLAEGNDLSPLRIDEVHDSGKIDDQILKEIATSQLILADLSGERPNCYYESGFAYALGRDIIFTIKKGEPIHFDLAAHRFIEWSTESDLREKLDVRIKAVLSKQHERFEAVGL